MKLALILKLFCFESMKNSFNALIDDHNNSMKEIEFLKSFMNHILENMTNREDFSLSEIYSVNCPQQQGNDCGLCVLKTIEVLINNFWEIKKLLINYFI